MGSEYTGHITQTEWRWVIFISTALVALAFVPFLWVLLIGVTGAQWQFMGALHDFQNSATELGRVYQGSEGHWLVRYLHTPEAHSGVLLNPLYAMLGQIARITSLSTILIFHVARVCAAMFMYMALYQLAAHIWMRVRTRRIFFILAAVSSGFGWLLAPLTGDPAFLDLTTPQAYPFYSTLVNVHFPLAIACLALIASVMAQVFRPGQLEDPQVGNGGLLIACATVILTLIYPVALLPVFLSFVFSLGYIWYRGKVNMQGVRWLLWFGVPALPLVGYYIAVLEYNTIVARIWTESNTTPPVNPLIFLLSLGLLVVIVLPGIWRAVRHFGKDGEQFMLIWLLAIVVLMYMPTVVQERFVLGIMIPLAYFGARSIEDFWFNFINRRWRLRLIAALIPVIAASHFLVLIVPLGSIAGLSTQDTSRGALLERDYLEAFAWINQRNLPGEVVLAAPMTSLWLPAWTGARAVYGHPTETLDAAAKREAVLNWYTAETFDETCDDLFNGAAFTAAGYQVKLVLLGPQERAIGPAACVEGLTPVGQFGSVQVYSTVSTR